MKKQYSRSKMTFVIINVGCILALLAVIFPLLLIARYDYPLADDWSYGNNAYQVIRNGGGLGKVLLATVRKAREAWLGWDGRFANAFLDALEPGIWGEKYYAVTPWILIGMLIFSEIIFVWFMLSYRTKNKENAMLWIPVVIPVLIIQILYSPSPTESFYWYTGGMNYTFMYSISLLLMVLFLCLGEEKVNGKPKSFLMVVSACVLAIFVGGGNFSTSLSTVFAFFIMTMLSLMKKEYFFLRRTWGVTLLTTVCLAVCLASPGSVRGNSARMTELSNPLVAICRSLFISFRNISMWTFTGGILLLLFFAFRLYGRQLKIRK